jgi:hypothetical protein
MSSSSVRPIFVEYFLSQALLYEIRNFLPLTFYRVGGKRIPMGTKTSSLVESMNKKAKGLTFKQSEFSELLVKHMKMLTTQKKPTKDLEDFITSHIQEIKSKIGGIPNTLSKARESLLGLMEVGDYPLSDQLYEAMVLLEQQVPAELIAQVVRDWKKESKDHEEEYKGAPFPVRDIFWVSRDFMETIDAISRYRFREHFGIGEFESAFLEVESMLAWSLLEGSGGIEAFIMPFEGDRKLTSVAFNLWLVSRSRNLPNRIRDFVNIALHRIVSWQLPEGWWSDFQLRESAGKDSKTGLDSLPNTYTTALCSLNLLKLSISEPMGHKGVLGVKWLLERQNPDGSWSRELASEGKIVAKPDIFLTLLSLESITRSGLKNVRHSIKLGIDWIMKQQNELGMWDYRGLPFPFMTVLVLEFMDRKDYFSSELDQYLCMSKAFLNRGVQLSLEENSNSRRLATITAFHGIEVFLYSVLSRPDVNIKVFEKIDKTIGMRKALTQFQVYLQDKGKIKPNQVLPYRNSLDRLAYLRDEVVHKGIDITNTMCRPLIDEAVKFAAKYSLEILGFDIFT